MGTHIRRHTREFINVLVKNLEYDCDDDKLRTICETYGEISSLKIMVDPSGKSKGFGFVAFETHEEAKKCVEDLNGKVIDRSTIYAERAQKPSEIKAKFDKLKKERKSGYAAGTTLFIKNLDGKIDDLMLRNEFAQFGIVTNAMVMTKEGKSRGFGYVCFKTPEEAAKAKSKMDKHIFGGRQLYVVYAVRKEDRKIPWYLR